MYECMYASNACVGLPILVVIVVVFVLLILFAFVVVGAAIPELHVHNFPFIYWQIICYSFS